MIFVFKNTFYAKSMDYVIITIKFLTFNQHLQLCLNSEFNLKKPALWQKSPKMTP